VGGSAEKQAIVNQCYDILMERILAWEKPQQP
jgi:hypothetical protein